jgi:hypothetical protein
MPLVPDASRGGNGVLSQTHTRHTCSHIHVIDFDVGNFDFAPQLHFVPKNRTNPIFAARVAWMGFASETVLMGFVC